MLISAGGTVDVNTPLVPFWNTQSSITTSVNCVSTTKYGYIYPEIAVAQSSNPQQISSAVRERVMELYGDGNLFNTFVASAENKLTLAKKAFAFPKSRAPSAATPVVKEDQILFAMPQKRVLPKAAARNPGPSPPQPEQTESQPHYVITPDNYQDWVVNVTIEKYALNGSGRICFFLGPASEIPENPAQWYTCPIYAGAFTLFVQDPQTTECVNCQNQAEARFRIGGTVHLTKTLITKHIPLTGPEPVEYLKTNLQWRAMNHTEQRFTNEDVPSLKVLVIAAGYTIGPDGKPERKPWTRYPEITEGKAGGAQHDQDI
jgi:tyrosinase